MKTKFVFLLTIFTASLIYSQSSIVYDSGTIIEVNTGSDISADQITVNGSFTGNGTFNNGPLPVELTSFTATTSSASTGSATVVTLNWQTATEVNNYGFEIERQNPDGVIPVSPPGEDLSADKAGRYDNNWEKVGFVQGHGNSNSPKEYSFTDSENSVAERSRSYRLKQIDFDGNFEYSEIITVETLLATSLPTEFALEQNYPNPFNPTTTIKYSIPNTVIASARLAETLSRQEAKQSQEMNVTLKVYDILGNVVSTLVNENQKSGYYEINFNASYLPSGVYFYRIQTSSGFVSTKKLMLLK